MRVHSTFEVNTHQQQNPFVSQSAGDASTGKTAQGLSFEDHLKSHFQQASSPEIHRGAESHVAGMFWGFFPSLRAQSESEPTLKRIAY